MPEKSLIERSPVRIFDRAIGGGLGAGNIGVVLARNGVGKTGFLIGLAIDALLRERKVLYISTKESVEHVTAFFEQIFHAMADELGMNEVPQRQLLMERGRHILCYNRDFFSLEKLEQSVAFLKDTTGFSPDMVIMDGTPALREDRGLGDRGHPQAGRRLAGGDLDQRQPPPRGPGAGRPRRAHRGGPLRRRPGRDRPPLSRERPHQGEDHQGAPERDGGPRPHGAGPDRPCCCAGARPAARSRRDPEAAGPCPAASFRPSWDPDPHREAPVDTAPVSANLAAVRDRLAAACRRGRARRRRRAPGGRVQAHRPGPGGRRLAAGQRDLGENRIQDALARQDGLAARLGPRGLDPAAVRWHFIGHLQSNKAARAVGAFTLLHGVDSVKLAERLSRLAAGGGRGAGDPAGGQHLRRGPEAGPGRRTGPWPPPRPRRACRACELEGLMGMARWGAPEAELRAAFARLRRPGRAGARRRPACPCPN